MFTISQRKLKKKELERCLQEGDFLCIPRGIPPLLDALERNTDLAYSAGAIFTDGYMSLSPTKGSVTFCQKPVREKRRFIEAVHTPFQGAFGAPLRYTRQRRSRSTLGGRVISGGVQDSICFRRKPAEILANTWEGIVSWVLSLDRESLLHFLAGVIDGDGTFNEEANRINIFVGKETLLQACVTACLRLGIVPQVTKNRQIHNLQISADFAPLLKYTKRVQGKPLDRLYSHRLFSVRALFADIVDQVNYMGRVREGIKRNILFGADKIERDLLHLCPPKARSEVEALLNSDLQMYRMRQVGELETSTVYNFEVAATNELDKNFVVFTEQYTPVIVSNSHAAVVARGWGKPCVAGCEAIDIDLGSRQFTVNGKTIKEGSQISINGTTGEVFAGEIATTEPNFAEEHDLVKLLGWADETRQLGVWTNADTPEDAARARAFGAEGIGLCRTEHMFFGEERRPIVVKMIMSENQSTRLKLLNQLLPFQRKDFEEIFRVMGGLPVIIRLIDPPMHEFLPPLEEVMEAISEIELEIKNKPSASKAKRLKKNLEEQKRILRVVRSLWEVNPMMGLRGCRAGIMYQGLTEMQTRAIFEAACNVAKEGVDTHPEVMIPLVSHVNELKLERTKLEKVAKEVMAEKGVEVDYKFGTMIEIPRAAITADKIAEYADFFSFGTNDLTQMTYGVSRDDAEGKFLRQYVGLCILEANPFEILDREGVGVLMRMAVEKGRKVKSALEIGGCGEHFGEPNSIEFSHIIGLNYVSCSPFRVPIARLAAAQAALTQKYGRDN
jgi:hypothetical protein